MAFGTWLISYALICSIVPAVEASTCSRDAEGACSTQQALMQDEIPADDASLELFQKKVTAKDSEHTKLGQHGHLNGKHAKIGSVALMHWKQPDHEWDPNMPFHYEPMAWGQWCGDNGVVRINSPVDFEDGMCKEDCSTIGTCNFISVDHERGMCMHYSTCAEVIDNPQGTWTMTFAKAQFHGMKGALARLMYPVLPKWFVVMVLLDLSSWVFNGMVALLVITALFQCSSYLSRVSKQRSSTQP